MRTETVHPDLIPYAVGGMIRHLLLFCPRLEDVSRINRVYREKIDEVSKAKAAGDWSTFVRPHE
jgi:hypothetical protein